MRRDLATAKGLIAVAAAAVIAATAPAPANAADIDSLHFLIPGGAGGGWDGTARGTGEALTKAGIVGNASYENMSGGGGGKAIAHLVLNVGNVATNITGSRAALSPEMLFDDNAYFHVEV